MPITAINQNQIQPINWESQESQSPVDLRNWAHAQANNPSNVSLQMEMYHIEQKIYVGLRHMRTIDRIALVEQARQQAKQLAYLTDCQGYIEIFGSLVGGGFGILGGFFDEAPQKVIDSIGKSFVQFSSFGKTFLDSQKIPIQTESQIITGIDIPQMDEESRNYFQLLKELKESILQLAHMEMQTSHSIFQG